MTSMAVMDELGDRGRRHADPEFVVLDLLGNADEHERPPKPRLKTDSRRLSQEIRRRDTRLRLCAFLSGISGRANSQRSRSDPRAIAERREGKRMSLIDGCSELCPSLWRPRAGVRDGQAGTLDQVQAGQDAAHRLPRRRAAVFVHRRDRPARRVHGRPLPLGRQAYRRGSQSPRSQGRLCARDRRESLRCDRKRQG